MRDQGIDYFSRAHPLRGFATKIAFSVRKGMFKLFMEKMRPDRHSLILDIGVTPDRALADSNYFEKFYPYSDRIVAAGVEDASFLEDEHPGLRFVHIDKAGLPFKNKAFDIVFCSAVLEHVGNSAHQQRFVREALRVSRGFFFTTPNRFFPVEFHTFLPLLHWFPQKMHQGLLRLLGQEFWSRTENLNLLSAGQMRNLFPDSGPCFLHRMRLLGMTSNLVIYGST